MCPYSPEISSLGRETAEPGTAGVPATVSDNLRGFPPLWPWVSAQGSAPLREGAPWRVRVQLLHSPVATGLGVRIKFFKKKIKTANAGFFTYVSE